MDTWTLHADPPDGNWVDTFRNMPQPSRGETPTQETVNRFLEDWLTAVRPALGSRGRSRLRVTLMAYARGAITPLDTWKATDGDFEMALYCTIDGRNPSAKEAAKMRDAWEAARPS